MQELKLPQITWVREYLGEHFPNQALPERAGGIDTVIIDVNDSQGRPKELRIACGFLRTFSKTTIQEYLNKAHIAQQLEDAP